MNVIKRAMCSLFGHRYKAWERCYGAVLNWGYWRHYTQCLRCGKPKYHKPYRLLDTNDAICASDERLLKDCIIWETVGWDDRFIGRRYDGNIFGPMRRKM